MMLRQVQQQQQQQQQQQRCCYDEKQSDICVFDALRTTMTKTKMKR